MLILVLIGTVQIGRALLQGLRRKKNERQQQHRIPEGQQQVEESEMSKTNTSGASSLASTAIMFSKDEKQHCFEINGRNVTVLGSLGKHDHGSSKVKLKNIVDYKWEQRNYPGRLIACHGEGKLIAYAITVNHRQTPEGMVRIVHLGLGQRALIKGMSGEVLDLQFAHSSSKILLGIIEQIALHVHSVTIDNDKIVCSLLLKVNDPLDGHVPVRDKLSWCPCLPDSTHDADDYASQLLVWSRGDIFQCYSISTVVHHYGAGEISGKDISEGGFKFQDSLPLITGAIFSADGTTLAVSCDDGVIRFYQVYKHTNDGKPRCLHMWKPHGGKTISSFFFLDNYTDQTLWKHAITCAENNTEIKVWCCETWECTQTIKFIPSIEQPLCFKAEIDPSSAYLVLSDMTTRELYVLQIRKDASLPSNGAAAITNGKSPEGGGDASSDHNSTSLSNISAGTSASNSTSKAYISSIAEFPLSSPILSFGILDVAVRMCKTSDAYLIEELEDYDEENSSLYCVVIRMFLVQPKSVQECHLFYQPNVTFGTDVRSTLSSISSSNYKNVSMSSISSGAAAKVTSPTNLPTESSLAVNVPADNNTSTTEPTQELKRILSPNVIADPAAIRAVANTSGSSGGGGSQPKVTLMTPDSFAATSEKSANAADTEAVNPDVLNTLFMLANATKQQQQLKTSVPAATGGSSPNDTLQVVDKQSPLNMLNIVNSTMIEEQEQAKVRKSVELQQKAAAAMLETPPVPPMPSAEMLASGGSSPSREVQEILSLKDNDCLNEYYDSDNILLDETDGIGGDDDELNDLENEIIEDLDDDEGYNFKNIDDDDDEEELGQRRVPTQKSASTAASAPQKVVPELKPINKEPSAPVATAEQVTIKSESKSSIDWPKVPEVPHPPQSTFLGSNPQAVPVPPAPAAPIIVTVPQNSKHLEDKLDRLLSIVQAQSRQITDLRSQLRDQQKSSAEEMNRYQASLGQLKQSVNTRITELVTRYDQKVRAEMQLASHNQVMQIRDMVSQTVPAIISKSISERLIPLMMGEVNRVMMSMVGSKLDQISAQIKMELASKMQHTDLTMRNTIDIVCRSQNFVEAVGNSLQVGVRKGLEQVYQESLRNIILPGFERSSQELFRQLNLTFSAGTKEYVQKLDQYVAQQKTVTDRTQDLAELVKKIPEQVNGNADRQYKASTTVLREDIGHDFKVLQTNLLKILRDTIRQEIEKGLEAQASSLEDSVLSAVRSQAQTPAPSMIDVQEQIRQMLNHGQINKAFHKALLSNDLSLVEFTMEKAELRFVFNPCPLEQTVLLSLIQQISADMSNYNDLKHRYLTESIINLRWSDPITKEHAPKVMRELTQNCQNFLAANPTSSLATGLRMLLMGIQALGLKQI
uniref:Putative enhancer of mrna-decapping protein 4 n=2 Tax=Culex tarsalis TaxID=7177 RepID=A0A1Q3EZN0_CULTA